MPQRHTHHILAQKKKLVYTRNFTNRLLHWITFFAVTVLLVTGYYIGDPQYVYGQGEAYNSFPMAWMRLIHFYAAMVLDVGLMIWVYLAFMSMHNRYWKGFVPTRHTLLGAWEVFKSYFNFKKPPFYRHFDPLDGILFALLLLFMVLQMATGFHLYAQALPPDYWWTNLIHLCTDWLVPVFGSSQNVRLVHHVMEWIVIAGVIVHVYLQVTKTIIWQDGHLGQIVGGYKFRDVE